MKTSWLVFLQVCSIEDDIEYCPDNLEDIKIPVENCYPSAPPMESFQNQNTNETFVKSDESLFPYDTSAESDESPPPSYESCVSEILLNNQWTSKRASQFPTFPKYKTSMPLCTGVIVNEKFIVTSAYCAKEAMNMVEEKQGNFLKIIAGTVFENHPKSRI